MNRSTHQKLIYGNTDKLAELELIRSALASHVRTKAISMLRDYRITGKAPQRFAGKDTYSSLDMSARVNQCVAKQAGAMVRSITKKHQKAVDTPEQFRKKYQKEFLAAFDQEDKSMLIKEDLPVYLDSRFVSIEPSNCSAFPYWLRIKLPKSDGFKEVVLPLKKTRHMKDLEKRGFSLVSGFVRIYADGSIDLNYTKTTSLKTTGSTMGIDMGIRKAVARHDGVVSEGYDALLGKVCVPGKVPRGTHGPWPR